MNQGIDSLSIESLHFLAGGKGNEILKEKNAGEGLVLVPSNLTVFVGPNNSGKSLTLKEIYNYLIGNHINRKVLKDIRLRRPQRGEDFIQLLKRFEVQPIGQDELNRVASGQTILARPGLIASSDRTGVNLGSMKSWFDAMNNNEQASLNLRRDGLKFFALMLDAQNRLALSNEQSTGPLEQDPKNHLWHLFTNPHDKKRVREECEAAFNNLFFTVDPTGMTHFRIRMSTEEPDENVEKNLGERGREFFQNALLISDLGDGVKCYVGMIASIVSLKQRFLFIDDPEAFLHPPVAHQLGQSLAKLASEYGIQLFVSTHSSNFLLGCLEASEECNIVRLTYSPTGKATTALLDNEVLLEWKRKPILRSTNVLDGLFHSCVVVTEGDSDRVVYEEINRRLLVEGRGVLDCEFLRAQNCDTVYKIIGPLNQIGVPVAGILDIDILYTNNEEEKKNSHLRKLLNASIIDSVKRENMLDRSDELIGDLRQDQIAFDDLQKYGIGLETLREPIKDDIRGLIADLANVGIFLVPNGALESWLKDLNIEGLGGVWVANCFDKLGYDSSDSAYVHPSSGDVWRFLDVISEYLRR